MPENFKVFRDSAQFVPIASAICVAAKKIVGHCRRVESGFSEGGIEAILDTFANGSRDFDDQLLAELCRAKGYKLVTDDGDFSFPGITVITANSTLYNIDFKPKSFSSSGSVRVRRLRGCPTWSGRLKGAAPLTLRSSG